MRLRIFIIIFFCSFTITSQAQFNTYRYWYFKPYSSRTDGEKKRLQRSYWSVHLPMMTMDANQHYTRQQSNGPAIDTSFLVKKKSGFGIGISTGGFFGLGHLRNFDMIALDYSLGYDIYTWQFKKVYFPGEGNVDGKASSSQFSLPLCVVYKHGGETDLNPQHRFLWSAGGGIEPGYITTKYMTAATSGFQFRPLIMGEVGIYSGIAFKLRAAYYPLSTTYVNSTGRGLPDIDDGSYLQVKATGTGNIVISLLFMFYAHHWGSN